jgi:hypothetical protein
VVKESLNWVDTEVVAPLHAPHHVVALFVASDAVSDESIWFVWLSGARVQRAGRVSGRERRVSKYHAASRPSAAPADR